MLVTQLHVKEVLEVAAKEGGNKEDLLATIKTSPLSLQMIVQLMVAMEIVLVEAVVMNK